MTTEYILAPNPRFQGRDQTGQPCAFGKLYTYKNETTTPKATYQDYLGVQPNTNPVILDGKGEANIYWATDELYTVKLFTSDDQEVYTQDNYPFVGDESNEVVTESDMNIARNNQFYYWYYGTSFSPVQGVGTNASQDYICDDWYYSRVSSSYTVNITRQTFAIDQDEVPGNPTYYFQYECTTTPTGETNNRLYQTYQGVQTLAGETISIGLYAKSATASTIEVYMVQNFGSGGSPSPDVETLVGQFTLTTNWEQYSGSITLPTLSGKTLGTSGNDELILRINFPNDVVGTINLCNIQFQKSSAISTDFPFQSLESQELELVNRVTNALFSTGDVKSTFKTAADPGWLMCNDTTIGARGSNATTEGLYTKALYTLLWDNVTNIYAPVYDSSGNVTTRGASATDDYNALKRILLTRTVGRAIASAGTATLSQSVTNVDTGTDTMTIGTADGIIYNATPVTFTTTGTLPSPLLTATTYYARVVTTTTFQLYPTLVDAVNGTNLIDLTTAGSGTITVTVNYGTYTLGQPVGELNHALLLTEVPAHTHTDPSTYALWNDAAANAGGGGFASLHRESLVLSTAGSSGNHNNIQPTVFMNYMIRL